MDESHPLLGSKSKRSSALLLVTILYALYSLAQLAAAFIANSLAIFADSVHMIIDVLTYIFNLYAANRTIEFIRDLKHTGETPSRIEIYASAVSAVSVCILAVPLTIEAILRLLDDSRTPEVNGELMVIIAVVGLAINVFCVFMLLRVGASEDLNLRSVLLHFLADFLRGISIIIAAVLIWKWGWIKADAYCTLVVCAFMFVGGIKLLYESYISYKQANTDDNNSKI